ncbi:hypothetical protein [Lacisediminimonas profundi]|uniref:hypothetical protein n=1 Tax=Lacisediminimonas profundi TaxID=2603856 RepID=UPI00124AF016|nr:hypothetical protein [Lacisediminimonas profundi]
MQNPSPPVTVNRLIQQALIKIGRNLLAFQRIEACLKIVTPYLTPTTGNCTAPPELDVQRLLADKQVLGILIQRLKDGTKTEDKVAFELYLKGVLDRRNELIHHFLCRHDAALDSKEKCRSVIKYLDEQNDFIQPMVALAEGYLRGFSFSLDLAASQTEGVTGSAVLGEA